jgi:Fe-S-cluster containining protein
MKNNDITKEDKFMAIAGNIPVTEQIKVELRKDLALFPGLTTKILNKVPCKRCGWCCNTKVLVNNKEIARIRKFLKLGSTEFMSKYIEIHSGIYYFPKPCPFLSIKDDKAECAIYSVRPEVCKDFPITFMMLIVGECHIGKELAAISRAYFEESARKAGVDPDSPIFNTGEQLKEAAANLEKFVTERQDEEYDPTNQNCKKLLVDHRSLQIILNVLNKKR